MYTRGARRKVEGGAKSRSSTSTVPHALLACCLVALAGYPKRHSNVFFSDAHPSLLLQDKSTGAKASTTIAATASRNSPDDVARMVEEARVNAAADKILREKVSATVQTKLRVNPPHP